MKRTGRLALVAEIAISLNGIFAWKIFPVASAVVVNILLSFLRNRRVMQYFNEQTTHTDDTTFSFPANASTLGNNIAISSCKKIVGFRSIRSY